MPQPDRAHPGQGAGRQGVALAIGSAGVTAFRRRRGEPRDRGGRRPRPRRRVDQGPSPHAE